MKEILVLCPFGVDKGLLSKAARLSGGELRALVPAGEAETAAEYGAGRIFELSAPEIGDESAFAAFLSETIRRWGSQIVLAPATVRMRNIMPMLAWQLDAGLTADCTALRMEGEQLIQTRPAFGNSLMADIRSLSEIQMATVRPGTFRPEKQAAKTPDVQTITYTPDERVKLHSFGSFAQGKPLSQAEIIVAGGMGVGSKAGFEKLEALAKKLGGSLGASRTAVEAGFVPYRCQVGMTGITVCPKLYIAVGISGAVQHLAGMSGSGKVVAINSDPKAPIFDYADYGIVGDWERRSRNMHTEQIIGTSPQMEHVRQLIDKVAPCEARVLITGENGTGKELVARWLHAKSSRAAAPFVEVNCAAIPSELIESELFGHEKGAFTSAIKQRKGKFEQADGGTLFMDEIGDMSLAAQAKVLRALQENKICRVGSDKDIDVDVRVIAATNKNLRDEITKGNFREDLYHRIGVIVVRVPALRDHAQDVPLLADHFIRTICAEYGIPPKRIESNALRELQAMRWSGNIRELRNVIERLIILSKERITLDDVKTYC